LDGPNQSLPPEFLFLPIVWKAPLLCYKNSPPPLRQINFSLLLSHPRIPPFFPSGSVGFYFLAATFFSLSHELISDFFLRFLLKLQPRRFPSPRKRASPLFSPTSPLLHPPLTPRFIAGQKSRFRRLPFSFPVAFLLRTMFLFQAPHPPRQTAFPCLRRFHLTSPQAASFSSVFRKRPPDLYTAATPVK